ncbi:unnamed protein product, partial [Ectocarpus sp. 8 AP-2014]
MDDIREEGDFVFNPALGGIWMKFRHCPSAMNGSSEWNTGFATPTIEFHLLMLRERLANTGGLVVEENHEYADAAAAAAGGGGGGGGGGEDGPQETTVKDWDVWPPWSRKERRQAFLAKEAAEGLFRRRNPL